MWSIWIDEQTGEACMASPAVEQVYTPLSAEQTQEFLWSRGEAMVSTMQLPYNLYGARKTSISTNNKDALAQEVLKRSSSFCCHVYLDDLSMNGSNDRNKTSAEVSLDGLLRYHELCIALSDVFMGTFDVSKNSKQQKYTVNAMMAHQASLTWVLEARDSTVRVSGLEERLWYVAIRSLVESRGLNVRDWKIDWVQNKNEMRKEENTKVIETTMRKLPPHLVTVMIACNQVDAEKIAEELVVQQHAACVQKIPSIQSIYRWRGKIESSTEVILLCKTLPHKVKALQECIMARHSYEVPEILSSPMEILNPDYAQWLTEALTETVFKQ